LVKCASDKKPEDKDWKEAVENCSDFLVRQIELLKPKLLVCNGKPVCEWFKAAFKKKEEKKEEKKAT
jgi:uracil-DNA glycosylase